MSDNIGNNWFTIGASQTNVFTTSDSCTPVVGSAALRFDLDGNQGDAKVSGVEDADYINDNLTNFSIIFNVSQANAEGLGIGIRLSQDSDDNLNGGILFCFFDAGTLSAKEISGNNLNKVDNHLADTTNTDPDNSLSDVREKRYERWTIWENEEQTKLQCSVEFADVGASFDETNPNENNWDTYAELTVEKSEIDWTNISGGIGIICSAAAGSNIDNVCIDDTHIYD